MHVHFVVVCYTDFSHPLCRSLHRYRGPRATRADRSVSGHGSVPNRRCNISRRHESDWGCWSTSAEYSRDDDDGEVSVSRSGWASESRGKNIQIRVRIPNRIRKHR